MGEHDRKVFGENLTYHMNRIGINGITLAKYMGVTSATVSDWMHGKKMPRVDKIKSLANYFHIKMTDLVEEHPQDYYFNPETARVAQAIFDDRDLHALFDAAQDSKPEDLQMAADLLRRLKATNPDG